MRFINTGTFELEEFANPETIKYAILSHRWEDEEIVFADMKSKGGIVINQKNSNSNDNSNGNGDDDDDDDDETNETTKRLTTLKSKKGFSKMYNFCRIARSLSFKYVWMDTCCIDKSSSAELSEAINSMWQWYSNAMVCFVYLADVTYGNFAGDFAKSQWFERGWTLQELLAPPRLSFYCGRWTYLGDRAELCGYISKITGIREAVVRQQKSIQQCRVAERMSWAAHRQTTRIEDRAYSLLGIFDVNMPLLYGEAEKAFVRLQEEIIKDSNDQSIFDWTEPAVDNYTVPSNLPPTGLLAGSPYSFRHWHGKTFDVTSHFSASTKLFPQAITSCGLLVNFELLPYKNGIFVALLDYLRGADTNRERPCIFVRMINFRQQFARVAIDRKHLVMFSELDIEDMTLSSDKQNVKSLSLSREIYVPQKRYKLYNSATLGLVEPLICSISLNIAKNIDCNRVEIDHVEARNGLEFERALGQGQVRIETDRPGAMGLVRLKFYRTSTEHDLYSILLGFDCDLRPVCILSSTEDDRQGTDAGEGHGRSMNDVSRKQLSHITCQEPQGWSLLEGNDEVNGITIAQPALHRPSFWAILVDGKFRLDVRLKGGPCQLQVITRLTSSRLACSIILVSEDINGESSS